MILANHDEDSKVTYGVKENLEHNYICYATRDDGLGDDLEGKVVIPKDQLSNYQVIDETVPSYKRMVQLLGDKL